GAAQELVFEGRLGFLDGRAVAIETFCELVGEIVPEHGVSLLPRTLGRDLLGPAVRTEKSRRHAMGRWRHATACGYTHFVHRESMESFGRKMNGFPARC